MLGSAAAFMNMLALLAEGEEIEEVRDSFLAAGAIWEGSTEEWDGILMRALR